MKSVFTQKPENIYDGDSISVGFEPNEGSLPGFPRRDMAAKTTGKLGPKSYKVPSHFQVERILEYLYVTLGLKECVIDTNRDN